MTDHTTTRTNDGRLIAGTGLAFLALSVIARLMYPAEPDFAGDARSIVAFYEGNEDQLLASNTIYLLCIPVLVVFAGALSGHLRRTAPTLGAVAFTAGAAGSGVAAAAASADTMAALRVGEQGSIDPAVATVLWDLQSVLFGLAAPMALGVFVLAVATAALRHGALPRWAGYVSAPLGVAMLIPPINYVAMIIFVFWVPVAGVAWLLHTREAATGAAASRPATALTA
jgi:hypothetical protein